MHLVLHTDLKHLEVAEIKGIQYNSMQICVWEGLGAVQNMYIVACQAHPALVKIGLVLARLFHFNSLLVCIRTKGLTNHVS